MSLSRVLAGQMGGWGGVAPGDLEFHVHGEFRVHPSSVVPRSWGDCLPVASEFPANPMLRKDCVSGCPCGRCEEACITQT